MDGREHEIRERVAQEIEAEAQRILDQGIEVRIEGDGEHDTAAVLVGAMKTAAQIARRAWAAPKIRRI